ncbi:MAG: hypothetical protein CMH13_17435 [Martelella sp.]|uniref:ATP-binding domain-containing protein n=1 Tax=unclassified Martelella TaxID=2629616 RepID=UPI000C44B8BA|nr:ATP-binding domain-containing protein [Martelella sp.]MAU22279.1 hypothetical protein [Martelella sp.]
MSDARETEEHIRPVAEESLETFDKVAKAAEAALQSGVSGSSPTSIVRNTFTEQETIRTHSRITQENLEGNQILSREPAIARVVVADENGQKMTYYFSRAAAAPLPDKRLKFASYRSRVGRLAELSIGDEYELPRDGETIDVEIVEHARFQPFRANQIWDARNAILEGDDYGPLTVESLRALLETVEEIDETALEELLKEESSEANVREGVRRAVISRMDLRDQPILDRYQGEIFRMPLGSRLLILGAPGTGKTTTLIRRLGQKLDLAFLDDAERQAIRNVSEADHAQSWIMFTPTELLRLYVKEAFNREGIPAPDDRIRTWAEFREELARGGFRILRSAASSSSLVMKETARTLSPEVEAEQIAWFSDFDQWQQATFWEEMRVAAKSLSENPSPEVAKLGRRVLAIIEGAGPTPQPGTFASLMDLAAEIGTRVSAMKETTDGKIRRGLNLQVNRDKAFLDDMAVFISALDDVPDDDSDQEVDDEEETNQPRVGRAAAVAAYMRAVRALARSRARKRSATKTGQTGRLLSWLGDRTLQEEELPEVGESLVVQSALRTFVNPVRRYIDGTPARYRRFRRTRQSEKRWYRADGFSATDVHPLEVDVMLLAMLRGTDELITGARALTNMETPARGTLERISQLYRTQVLVDEATDFSPLQLACMATMARPTTRSFFACGDFNQRVTNWGTRTRDEMKWVLPDIATRTITVAYRQSRQLHNLARQLVVLSGGSEDDAILPDFAENEGVPPVLAKDMGSLDDAATWLADRIVEIEGFVGDLPSIAVLVNDENEVSPVAAALSDALAEHNISVEACLDGRVRGRDGAVRVFNVQHIKGLEFEAVFFVGIDRLAERHPDLFDKYLYVGATRAATYLGLTCEESLPPILSPLEELFGPNWL